MYLGPFKEKASNGGGGVWTDRQINEAESKRDQTAQRFTKWPVPAQYSVHVSITRPTHSLKKLLLDNNCQHPPASLPRQTTRRLQRWDVLTPTPSTSKAILIWVPAGIICPLRMSKIPQTGLGETQTQFPTWP